MPNIPAAGHWRLLYLPYFAATEGWAAQIAVGAVENSGLCWRKARGPEWQPWEFAATTTPPQEYDLPLAEGITALQPCTYYKNQFSEVTLGGCTSGSVSDGATIATLPEGFRPDHPVERPATFTANGNRYAGSVFIAANGIVSIHTPAEATNVVFAASFLAKN